MKRTLVAGVDSSTQATKVVVRDARTGALVREGRAPHPDGTEVDPRHWLYAFEHATRGGLLDGVAAMSIGGQQHGLVLLNEEGDVVRPALLWNDTRSAQAASNLVTELGGCQAWADSVGTVPVASITIAKLRWVAEHEPDKAALSRTALLPHDYLTWRLAGGKTPPVTDRGDASGTGYWAPSTGSYRRDLFSLAFGRELELPQVLRPNEPAGLSRDGVLLGPGTGDNMAAALGLNAKPGDVIVSVGTSGTVFAVHDCDTRDPTGVVAGFADATGRFLPLVCTLNAARILSATAAMIGTDLAGLDAQVLSAPPGADGLVVLPYFEGERTPNRPTATGIVAGLRLSNASSANLARAAVEGMICGLADGLEALQNQGVKTERVLLIGGGARSRAVQEVAATLFNAPVIVPRPGEYVADGAARQAAWVLSGEPEPPDWIENNTGDPVEAAPAAHIRATYAELRDATNGWVSPT